jgi:hypothetical protein
MRKCNLIYFFIGLIFAFAACESPDKLTPSLESNPINNVSVTFTEGDFTYDVHPNAIFTLYVTDPAVTDIVIPVPWFYPIESYNETSITRMQVRASLANNCTLSPALGIYDMTQKNVFTLTDYHGRKSQISISAVRYKLTGCTVSELKALDNVTGTELYGIIDDTRNVISFISTEDLTDLDFTYRLFPHATAAISSGSFSNVDISSGIVTLTVTAHDGVTTKTYSIRQEIPNKIDKGIRRGSYRLLFEKTLAADLGITTLNMTGGIAATKDYVVLNTRGEGSVYINAKTGNRVGAINLGAITGSLTNFYNTADADGNILINNLAPNAGTFKLWKLASVTGTPELFIDWTTSGSTQAGRKVSVNGSLDGNAIITAGLHNVTNQFARWTVVNGVLTSHTPDIVTITGYSWSNNNVDVVYTSSTDVTADYFVVGYSDNRLARINGLTNTLSDALAANDQNYISNAVDYVTFNNSGFVAYSHANSFNWGSADQVWVIDASNPLLGAASSAALWESVRGRYGPNALGLAANGNGTADVAFRASDDGYYLYFYFMFTNGYVVGVQFDCIDM